MINLSKAICFKIAQARREEGLSQSEVAAAVGCKQSAISMFEKGNPTKISEDTVKKLLEKFKISVDEPNTDRLASVSGVVSRVVRGYCPNVDCPTNVPYVVGKKIMYRPSRMLASPNGGRRCAMCGEILEMVCPECGSQLNDGACCNVCGNAYVASIMTDEINPVEFAAERRREIGEIRSFS